MSKIGGIVMFLIALLPQVAAGQCDWKERHRPDWTNGFSRDLSSSYIEVADGSDYDIDGARKKAIAVILVRRGYGATGADVRIRNGEVVSNNASLIVKMKVLDEYTNGCRQPNGQYKVYVLAQIAKNPSWSLEGVDVTDEYGFSPRAFIPGLAQIHKGSTAKGIMFMLGAAACIGAAGVAEYSRSYCVKKSQTMLSQEFYTDKADQMAIVRNSLLAGAAVIYLWNFIDGIAAKGKKHVVVHARLKVRPFATEKGGGGVALSWKF